MDKTRLAVKRVLDQKQDALHGETGLLGNDDGIVSVPGKANYVYVRLAGRESASQVYNVRVKPVLNAPVKIGFDPLDPWIWQVLTYWTPDSTSVYDYSSYVPIHHQHHEWLASGGGDDVVFVDLRQFMPFRVGPGGGLTISVYRGIAWLNGIIYPIEPDDVFDLSSLQPTDSGKACLVLVTINSAGAIITTAGAEVDLIDLATGNLPAIPTDTEYVLAAVQLYQGQTEITESDTVLDIVDLRFPMWHRHGFTELRDTPHNYGGQAGKMLVVRQDETGIAFDDVPVPTITIVNVGGGGSGLTNPMTTTGDIIYQAESATTGGDNLAVYELGASATASSEYNPTYQPAGYVLRSNVAFDLWENLNWISSQATDPFTSAWIYIDLGAAHAIAGWSMVQGANTAEQASAYAVSKSDDGLAWTPIVTHTAADGQAEAVSFASPQTAQFFKFQPTANRMGLDVGQWWKIYNIGLYESGSGAAPERLPIGDEGEVLTVVSGIPSWKPPSTESLLPFDLTIAEAGWSWFMEPRAVYSGGKTFFGYVETDADISVQSFDHATKTITAKFTVGSYIADDHCAPTLLVRNSDKKLLVFYRGTSSSHLYQRTSTNPEDATAWGAGVDIASSIGATIYAYMSPIQLTGETNEPIYLFNADEIGGVARDHMYSKSTDGGATWGAKVSVYRSTNWSYLKFVRNGTSRIDFVATDNHPNAGATSVYHFYYQGGNYYKSDGTLITGGLPFDESKITKIYDGATNRGWIWDIAIDDAGNPVIAFTKFISDSDHRYMYAHWNGAAWVINEITPGGGYLYAAEPHYSGGMALDHSDPTVAYISKVVDGQWEIYRYQTPDGGATWLSVAVTAGSTVKNIRPAPILDHAPGYPVLFLAGTYNSYSDYAMKVRMVFDEIGANVGGGGAGDMLKSVYDTDNDGVVDNAEALETHPASYFATASHTHASGGKYRQFLYALDGAGDFQFLTDSDGNPLMALLDLE